MPFEVVARAAPRAPDALRPSPGRYSQEYLIAELHLWAEHHDWTPPRIADWNRGHARRHDSVFEEGWPSTTAVEKQFGTWAAGLQAAGFPKPQAGAPVEACVDCDGETRSKSGRCGRCREFYVAQGLPWSPENQAAAVAARKAANPAAVAARERSRTIRELRASGLNNIQIAAKLGVSQAAVANALTAARRRGEEVPATPYRPASSLSRHRREVARAAAVRRQAMLAARADGEPVAAIAGRFGLKAGSVRNALSQARHEAAALGSTS